MLRQWLTKKSRSDTDSDCSVDVETLGLPSPKKASTSYDADVIVAGNSEIIAKSSTPSKKRKRERYNDFDGETRAKMARHAIEYGVMNASRKFSVTESSIRYMKQAYLDIKKSSGSEPDTLDRKNRGKPTSLGDLDKDVQTYVKYQRIAGNPMSVSLLLGAANGIVKTKNKKLLKEYGGHVELGKPWAQSFFRRMGYVLRKGTKAARKVPDDFDSIRTEYFSEIRKLVCENDIPDNLIINFDQTNVYIVPAGHYTLEKSGAKQVPIIGLEDKRQIMAENEQYVSWPDCADAQTGLDL